MEKVKYPHNPNHKIGTCSECGEEMVYNVPRLGANGGFIHKETGGLSCKIKLGGIKFPQNRLIPNKNKPDLDKCYTSDLLAERIVNHFGAYGNCIEPCYGEGAFVRALEKHEKVLLAHWWEIDKGKDFLAENIVGKYDCLFSNFPFSLYRKFLAKSMSLADNLFLLSPSNHVIGLTARRRDTKKAGFFVREICEIDRPENFVSSGFQWAIVHLSKQSGDCKFSDLK